MTDLRDQQPLPTARVLEEIEALAVELARVAGAEIVSALQREVIVEYKSEAERGPSDPVSEVDQAVETLLRERISQCFPDHAIIGEELDEHPAAEAEFVWVVDPVDGTANFVNGFPMFASSIGVLHHGRPIAGAIWCSTSHELRPGVYHAHDGGTLLFEQVAAPPGNLNTGVRRYLAAAPGGAPVRMPGLDHRTTGSAALECAFVAAGILRAAHFWGPSIWDVAAGVTLARAAGFEAWTRAPHWRPLERFEAPASVRETREPSLRDWRRPLVLGDGEAATWVRTDMDRRRGRRARLARRMSRWIGG